MISCQRERLIFLSEWCTKCIGKDKGAWCHVRVGLTTRACLTHRRPRGGHKGVTSQGSRVLTSPGQRDSPEESAALSAGSRPARDYVSESRFPPAITLFHWRRKAAAAMMEDDDDDDAARNDKGKFHTAYDVPRRLVHSSLFLAAPLVLPSFVRRGRRRRRSDQLIATRTCVALALHFSCIYVYMINV